MLSLALLIFILYLGVLIIVTSTIEKDISVLHPMWCVFFFMGLQFVSNIYVLYNERLLHQFVLGSISVPIRAFDLTRALIYEGFAFVAILVAIFIPIKSKSFKNEAKDEIKVSWFLVVGLLFTMLFFLKAGGIGAYWRQIALRSSSNAGLGYYQSIGGYSLLFFYVLSCHNGIRSVFRFIALVAIASYGSRGLVLIAVLARYLYRIDIGFAKMNFYRVALLVPILLVFILSVLSIRKIGFDKFSERPLHNTLSSISYFEEGFIVRMGRLERETVILSQFKIQDYWLGKEYFNLLTAPIPRTIYKDKPAVDTGVFVRLASMGKKYPIDTPANKIATNSWPQQNWSGYMNFGLIGLVAYHFISGLILKYLYTYRNKSYLNTLVYIMIFVGGGVHLSVPGIVKILTLVVLMSVVYSSSKFVKKLSW